MATALSDRPICYIYAEPGSGVSPVCVDATEQALKRVAGLAPDQIKKITNVCEFYRIPEGKSVIIIPGGFAPDIAKALMPGYDKIREIISKGGSYIGFCAGANIGANKFTYRSKDRDGKETFQDLSTFADAPKTLGLSPFDATGPIFDGKFNEKEVRYEYTGTPLGVIVLLNPFPQNFWRGDVFHNSGSSLKLSKESYSHSKLIEDPYPLATYLDGDLPCDRAIVRNNYGEGSVVLSSVHPELSFDLLNTLRERLALKPGKNIFWPYHTESAFKAKFSPLKESSGFNEFLLNMIFTEAGIIPRVSEEEEKCPA